MTALSPSRLSLSLLFLFLLSSSTSSSHVPSSPFSCNVGSRFKVTSGTTGLGIDITGLSSPTSSPASSWVSVWRSANYAASGAFLRALPLSLTAPSADGMFDVKTTPSDPTCPSGTTLQTQALTQCSSSAAVIQGTLSGDGTACKASVSYTFTIASVPESDGQLLLKFAVASSTFGGNIALAIAAESSADEAIHGLGEQYTVWDLKGRLVPMLTSEQGVGRGVEPLTALLNTFHNGAGGNWHTTYAPIPHYITSEMRSFALENTQYSTFDFTLANATVVTVFSPEMRARVFIGTTPPEHVEEYTLFGGRMQPLPDWITQGPVLGFEGGTDAVLNMSRVLQSLGIQVAAFWVQDWSGVREDHNIATRLWWNWEVDDVLYHDWDALVATLAANGTRIMTYINPFLASTVTADKPNFKHDYFKEAAALGYLVKNSSGDPYILFSSTKDFTFGTIDLTSPDAAAWYMGIMRDNMIARGHSGWMSDFAEYIPFDAVLANGSAPDVHNDFPRLWAQANRMAITNGTETLPIVFFSRSGFTGSPKQMVLLWDGDQLTTWDNFDGLQTTITVRLSAGLSGFSLAHSDIGGYTMVDEYGVTILRNKELLLRWMESSAVGDAIMRSHPGTKPAQSWQIYSDNSTLVCFARMAALHHAMRPYRLALMDDAWQHGWPLVRSLWFHYPADAVASNITDQYLVGSDCLVAPIVCPGCTGRDVYLPRGVWTLLWDGKDYGSPTQPTTLHFEAPIGKPIVLFAQGSQVAQQVISQLATIEKWECTL